jgi:GH15 family glucan-1,4-alpha-glucosidase
MNSYPLISEHGLIGDLQTAALVSTGGTVDWLCLPRFDSPSVFASLLDADRGGRFRIAPQDTNYVAKQLYFPDTAVLITRFMSPTASARSRTSCRSTIPTTPRFVTS